MHEAGLDAGDLELLGSPPGGGIEVTLNSAVLMPAEAHGRYARAANDPKGGARLEVSFGGPRPSG